MYVLTDLPLVDESFHPPEPVKTHATSSSSAPAGADVDYDADTMPYTPAVHAVDGGGAGGADEEEGVCLILTADARQAPQGCLVCNCDGPVYCCDQAHQCEEGRQCPDPFPWCDPSSSHRHLLVMILMPSLPIQVHHVDQALVRLLLRQFEYLHQKNLRELALPSLRDRLRACGRVGLQLLARVLGGRLLRHLPSLDHHPSTHHDDLPLAVRKLHQAELLGQDFRLSMMKKNER